MLQFSKNSFYSFFIISAYFLLIACGLLLPSDGNHGALNPKSLAFAGTIFFLGLHFALTQSFNFYQLKILTLLFYFLLFLFSWLLIALIHGNGSIESPMDQFKIFLITVLFVLATLYLINHHIISATGLLKTVIYLNLLYSVIKVTFVVLHVLGFLNIFDLLEKIGVRYMSMGIFGSLMRMQTSVDIITPFLTLFVLHSNTLQLNLNKKLKLLFLMVSPFAIFLSFSRYLILVALVCYFFYWASLKMIGKLKILLLLFAIFCAGLCVIGITPMMKILESRNQGNYQSDLTRVIQTQALITEFENYPFFGKGIGGYAESSIRDYKVQHSYEVQWVAFLMQFGLIGMMIILFPLGIISWTFFKPPLSIIKISFFLLFILWLLSGFTNPFLISLTSGIVYSIFMLAANLLSKEDTKHLTTPNT